MLSQTAEYALRVMVPLAERTDDRPARTGQLAGALDIPQNYLAKTLHPLARAGVLTSSRGKGGGFRLSHPATEISLLEVDDPFDRLGTRPTCLMGQGQCSEANACAAHASWKAVSQRVQVFFQESTLADPARKPASKSVPTARKMRRV